MNYTAMLLRSLLMGIAGAIGGAISMILISWHTQPFPPEAVYLLAASGFVTLAVMNFIFEYFDLYRFNLWRRFFGRKRD